MTYDATFYLDMDPGSASESPLNIKESSKDSVEKDAKSGPYSYRYEDSYSTGWLIPACVLTFVFYGGACWLYPVVIPFEEDEEAFIDEAHSKMLELLGPWAPLNLKSKTDRYYEWSTRPARLVLKDPNQYDIVRGVAKTIEPLQVRELQFDESSDDESIEQDRGWIKRRFHPLYQLGLYGKNPVDHRQFHIYAQIGAGRSVAVYYKVHQPLYIGFEYTKFNAKDGITLSFQELMARYYLIGSIQLSLGYQLRKTDLKRGEYARGRHEYDASGRVDATATVLGFGWATELLDFVYLGVEVLSYHHAWYRSADLTYYSASEGATESDRREFERNLGDSDSYEFLQLQVGITF